MLKKEEIKKFKSTQNELKKMLEPYRYFENFFVYSRGYDKR